MWERIREMIRKELRQTLREPRMRAMLIMPPLMQLLIFGFAVNLDVEHAKLAWMDQDNTVESRELLDEFTGSGRFTVVRQVAHEEDTQHVLDSSMVDGVVRIQPGFAADLARGRAAAVQVLVDGSNSNTANLVSAQCTEVISRFSAKKLVELQRQKMVGRAVDGPLRAALPNLVAEPRVWFNPELKSRNYFVPGVLVNIIMLVTLTLTSMAIVGEKEVGTMEQLMVTPIRPIELIIGKTLPFAAIGLVQLVLVTVVALLVFQVPLHGSPLLLVFSSIFFIECTLGMGLFISTISDTHQQAMMTTLFVFQPAFMLSGFSFPIRNMPQVVQWITYINPMRYFMEVVRGIFLKGVGLEVLWPQILMLAILGTSILGLSVLRFHKRLD
ncbi:ABC transporter permease [Bryobacter aggregatus]|uniref:ABC transporter permease n=1 Tax=Bryobacter aggregatus TaxID=360054 RepID=UPI0004E2602E|nr:ABC transporter permease [Bryobacter aggregatus]